MNKEKMTRFHTENILDAADVLFSKNGFDNTTIDMIAKASEYSKPTIYAYFSSKEEIYACNLYRYMLKFKDGFEEILSLDLPVEQIYLKCCRAVVTFKRSYPVYFLGVIGGVDYKNGSDEGSTGAISELGNTINSKICCLFRRAAEEGFTTEIQDTAFAYSYIWSCVMGVVTSPKFSAAKFESEEACERALDTAFMQIIDFYRKR